MKKIVTFGEIMGRMTLPNKLKFRQGLPGKVDLSFGGAEANVAASLSMQGYETEFVSALPKNDISDAVLGNLRNLGVGTSHLLRTMGGRLGLYFVEEGANQRPSKVIYDREYSSVSLVDGSCYDWDDIFSDAKWFHVSGITPALSKAAADATLLAVKKAKEYGVTVSCDLNFRKKLWKWVKGQDAKELARTIMKDVLKYVDIVIGNEEDADDVLNIKAGSTDVNSGKLEIEKYPIVANKISQDYPNVKYVAITLRESLSATHNNWGAMLYDVKKEKSYFAPLENNSYNPYEIKNIVDRIGGGDSFSAGLISAFNDSDLNCDNQMIINFAVASSCLCHSIYGDVNFSSKEEVLALARGNSSGRVQR